MECKADYRSWPARRMGETIPENRTETTKKRDSNLPSWIPLVMKLSEAFGALTNPAGWNLRDMFANVANFMALLGDILFVPDCHWKGEMILRRPWNSLQSRLKIAGSIELHGLCAIKTIEIKNAQTWLYAMKFLKCNERFTFMKSESSLGVWDWTIKWSWVSKLKRTS